TLDEIKPILSRIEQGNNEKIIVIALRIREFSVLKSVLTEQEENTLISNITLRVKNELRRNSAIIAPSSHTFFIAMKIGDESIESVMERIDRAVSSVKFTDNMNSIDYISGISLAPEHGEDVNDLIHKANIALEAISRVKNSKYLLFDHNVFEEMNQYYRIRSQIENAFENNEFHVVYQPQNNARTNSIIGLEALVRWSSSTLGPVSPSIFVPIMEEDNSQIKKLGKYILKKVILECKDLLSELSSDFRISINLSSQEFIDIEIIRELVSLIQTEDFPLKNISFEITETVLSDDLEFTNNIIEVLHHNDITVAIDDFGTGYSSLGYLKKLDTDKLKVDRLFIKDYPENDDGSILRAIAKLAHELNMKIIVEGVETEIQRQFIIELGCQEYQGYYCSKPIPIAEIKRLL
ncbi:MAG: GGDEF domain-containing phosphodiesterase, partial [Spirochaetales bacterium]|nr:GGDEF domain-containing phosphodiesterase [Spirochaetales bacterium]